MHTADPPIAWSVRWRGYLRTRGDAEERDIVATLEGLWVRWRADILLAVIVLVVTAPVLQPLMAQQASRYALTAAVWDERTITIDSYDHLLSVDRAERDGRLYSDKAPGQPLLAVPAYALYRALGGHPATEARVFADPGLWAVTFVSAMVPAALLAVAMRRFALRVARRRATHAALAMALGTMLLPFGTVLFSHVLAALLGVVAYLVLTARDEPGPWRLVGAGALAGAAVSVEYTAGIVAVVITAVAVLARRRHGAWVAVGGAGPAALLGIYHTLAFGGPLETGYRHSTFAEVHERGFMGASLPDPGTLLAVLVGERGLFLLTPIVLLATVGLVALLWRVGAPRRDAVAGLVVLAAFLSLMSGWGNPTGGASPGPRYVVVALPFLVGGVAWVWERIPSLAWMATLVGAATMGLATFTLPLMPRTETAVLEWWARVAEGRTAQTWLTEATGSGWAILVPLAVAGALAVWLLWLERQAGGPRDGSRYEDELAAVTVGDLEPLAGPIVIEDYDPQWPARFEAHAARIRRALGEVALRVEHVGSTAVPGLPAKPVIDVLVVVADAADEDRYREPMEAAGYTLRIREPDWYEHRVFRGRDAAANVHVLPAGCPEIERMLTFRDRLRTSRTDRDRYADAKRRLARREWTYVQQYADAKTQVVEEILARAVADGG
jgi:GrpB-like predicted nucleotidyltransferase (UPF0157 family)